MIIKKIKVSKFESKVLNEKWEFGEDGQIEDILIKAVVEDNGTFESKEMLKINKGVKEANVFLRYRVLLLGKKSRAIISPQLEIESNDIKAGHSATIGRIDEEQLFYLMSRGLSQKKATELIVNAFLE